MSRTRLSAYTAAPAEVASALDALRAEHGITDFPPEALAEARAAAEAWEAGGPQRLLDDGARDARDLPLVTIDPPGSMDLDQALALERLVPADQHGPSYRVNYAIASLATFITPGGALDTELRRRGETIYAPDAATPLHPEALSHGAASLLEDVERPACLWTIDLDARGEILTAHVERALVRSRARLTYAQVQEALDGASLPASVPPGLPALLEEIGRLRLEREAERGGTSLTTPEQEIEKTEGGGYRLVYRASLPVEDYNAQISLMTGISAAAIMVRHGVGILRTLPPARDEDEARLRRVARALGIDWPAEQPYPELLRSLDHQVPAHAAFMDQAMSLFRGSGYLAFNGPDAPGQGPDGEQEAIHAAIASRYAHVTAPLRRLVDRYGEEVCIAACAGQPVPDWVAQALPELPEVMSRTGRLAKAIGRGAVSILEAMVLAGHEGQVFEGVITSVREGRGELMLTEPAVVTEIRASAPSPPGGGSAPRLPVGQRVRARLRRADPATGRTDFELV